MNRQYLEYLPEVGIPAANSHHGQQHQLHKQPECKAANLSNCHDDETCFPWADHVRSLIPATSCGFRLKDFELPIQDESEVQLCD